MLETMSEDNEFSVFITPGQRQDILLSVFSAYYRSQLAQGQAIFDTNRLWCSKLPLLKQLFPQTKVICCVRNLAWIMDSLERLVRNNTLEISGMFNNRAEVATVYSRTEALSQGNRLVGFAYSALKEAFYGDQAGMLLLVEYDLLARDPDQTLRLIYEFLGEEFFEHDYQNLEYSEPEFDHKLKTQGLHHVRSQVKLETRRTILPPDLFEKFSQLSFWKDTHNSLANVICVRE